MKQIPKPEDFSPEYSRLMERHVALMARDGAICVEERELHAQAASEPVASRHADRVSSLLAGVEYTAPVPIKDRLAELAAERRAIAEALREIAGQLKMERERTSRLIVAQFDGEHAALAADFFRHVAAAAAVHATYGEMRRGFHRAGVVPAGFTDFGIELFGDPGHRNGQVGVAMRAASRRGYLKQNEIPEAYR